MFSYQKIPICQKGFFEWISLEDTGGKKRDRIPNFKTGVLVKMKKGTNSYASEWLQHSEETWEAQVQA